MSATPHPTSIYMEDVNIEKLLDTPVEDIAQYGPVQYGATQTDLEAAEEDLGYMKARIWKNKHRRYNPGWSWPGEITQLLFHPQYLTKPKTETVGLGHDDHHRVQVHQLALAEVPARRPPRTDAPATLPRTSKHTSADLTPTPTVSS